MIEKIIVVAPTTAVPISTGLAVALNVLPAPSFSSRRCLAVLEVRRRSRSSFLICCADVGDRLDQRQLEDRLGVVGHRAVGVDRDGHRPMPRKPKATRPKANTAGATMSAAQTRSVLTR